jgi:DNA polymerase V
MNGKDKETGFPSPAQGYEEKGIDFNQLLITNPPATYVMVADSSDMESRGIFPGSYLVVDRSIKPKPGALVVAAYEGEFRFREVVRDKNKICLTDRSGLVPATGGETIVFGTIKAVVTLL